MKATSRLRAPKYMSAGLLSIAAFLASPVFAQTQLDGSTTHSAPTSARLMGGSPVSHGAVTTDKLQLWGMGSVIAKSAIPWPGTPKNTQYYTMLPVVHVKFVSGGPDIAALSAPKSIATSVPPSLKGKLVAYFIQLDTNSFCYLIGPRGMTGQAVLAGDGGFGVYLHNNDAQMELDLSGGAPAPAASMVAPFFPTAGEYVVKAMPGPHTPWTLAPVTIVRPVSGEADFAFAAKNGRNMAGVSFFLTSPYPRSALFAYKSDSRDWALAPYVMQAASNFVNNVQAPELGGTSVSQQNKPVSIGGQSYTLPHGNPAAIQTPQGIAWVWQPAFVKKLQGQAPTSTIPTSDYFIMIEKPKGKKVAANGPAVDDIPFVRVVDGENDAYYAFPSYLSMTENRWIWYWVSWAGLGMNQPATNDLHVFDLKTNKDTVITSFGLFGGVFFSVGTSRQYLAYDQSGIIDAKGDTVDKVTLVNLASGEKEKLPSSDLTTASDGTKTVRATVNGQQIVITMQPLQ